MIHPLVTQLHFTRSEFVRCLAGVTAEEAIKRFEPMNCLSWIVGHLACHEHYLWIEIAQGRVISPGIYKIAGYQSPPTTPAWDVMWSEWKKITSDADKFLGSIGEDITHTQLKWPDGENPEDAGISILRNIYHYWFHLGEAFAIRQLLGHTSLPEFVGNMASVKHN